MTAEHDIKRWEMLFMGVLRTVKRARHLIRTAYTDLRGKDLIDDVISEMLSKTPFPLFRIIEIETINRCNGTCSFCPVNRRLDPRTPRFMREELFRSILEQLGELGFDGLLSLYSNNEPLLDARLVEFAAMAKRLVPRSRLNLFTNGTLLTVPLFRSLMEHLDRMIIDNYSDRLAIHPNVREVADYWKSHPLPGKKAVFSVRREDDILTSRGGTAPNRQRVFRVKSSCMLPFCQMVVRPDGKLSLCCNDALGGMTLGDLNQERVLDAWNGAGYREMREKIRTGRKNVPACSRCDSFIGVSRPELDALPAYCSLGR